MDDRLLHVIALVRTQLALSLPVSVAKRLAWRLVRPRVDCRDPKTPHFDAQAGIFRFGGTDREIGCQFAQSFDLTETLAAAAASLRREDTGRTERSLALLKRCAPAQLEFLSGIAERYPRFGLNAVARAAFASVQDRQPYLTSCGSVALQARGRPVVGQNLDLGRSARVALASIAPESGTARLVRINVGYPWITSFVNAHGLVASGASVNVADHSAPEADLLPQEFLFDILLSRCRSVDEALALLDELPAIGPLDGGVNAILCDASGAVRRVEITGAHKYVEDVSGGFSVATNHFRSADMAPLNRDDEPVARRLDANSRQRYELALRLRKEGRLTAEALRGLLREENGPGSWLRKARWPDIGYTSASYVVDMDARRVEFWLGAEAESSRHLVLEDCFDRRAEERFTSGARAAAARVYVLCVDAEPGADVPMYEFSGAEGRVRWPMEQGYGLGTAGAFNAFLRMGYVPKLVDASSAPRPAVDDLLLVYAAGRLGGGEMATIERWLQAGAIVVASGPSKDWSRFLPGVRLEPWRETIPYAGLASVLEPGRTELFAPPRWSCFRVAADGGGPLATVGALAVVHGERESPVRALVSAQRDCPAAVRLGRFVLLNGDPFAAFQAWLQGQEDLQSWIAWRHGYFWLDELVAYFRELLVRAGALEERARPGGIEGLGATTVVLRHDLDHSRDLTYVRIEDEAGVPGVHAILRDSNTAFWRRELAARPKHEAAFHYNTAYYSRVANYVRRKLLRLAALPYLPLRGEVAGKGLLRQVRWAKRAGVGIETLHRHLTYIYYPEFIDAMDAVLRHEPAVLGGSSFFRGHVLRWGVDRLDGARGGNAEFPYWFPFKLAHAGDGGRLLRGWETTSMMELEPGLVEQLLDYRIPGIPQRLLVLNYHPAHAQRPNFAPGGSVTWFKEVLGLLRARNVRVLSLRQVFNALDQAALVQSGAEADKGLRMIPAAPYRGTHQSYR